MNYVVRIGDLDFDSSDDGAHPVEVLIEEIMIHSEYNDISHENDAAVLKTDRKVQFTCKFLYSILFSKLYLSFEGRKSNIFLIY